MGALPQSMFIHKMSRESLNVNTKDTFGNVLLKMVKAAGSIGTLMVGYEMRSASHQEDESQSGRSVSFDVKHTSIFLQGEDFKTFFRQLRYFLRKTQPQHCLRLSFCSSTWNG